MAEGYAGKKKGYQATPCPDGAVDEGFTLFAEFVDTGGDFTCHHGVKVGERVTEYVVDDLVMNIFSQPCFGVDVYNRTKHNKEDDGDNRTDKGTKGVGDSCPDVTIWWAFGQAVDKELAKEGC